MGAHLAEGFGLRVSLRDPFTSLEPGAPPSAPVGVNPSGFAVNEATHTVYVVNDGDNTVSVIDSQACNARNLAGCGHPLATISLGPPEPGPGSAVLSPDGGTLYVDSPGGANSVAVIDAATCNAVVRSGCGGGPVATVATGNAPIGMAVDAPSQTLYVANLLDNTVSVIDASQCNAQHPAGCTETAPVVPVGVNPTEIAINPDTRTVYVANAGDNTVSAIDATRCNAKQPGGCTTTPAAQAVGGAPDVLDISTRSDTVYAGTGEFVSVIDGAQCNGGHPQGCSSTPPPEVEVGNGDDDFQQGLVVDEQTQNVYVADDNDDSLSVIDGERCNARHLAGCAQQAPTVQTGADPAAVAIDESVSTVYVADFADNAVAVIPERDCTGGDPVGCRPAPVPAAPLAPDHALAGAAVDAAEHTAYVEDQGVNFGGPFSLDLIDTNTCNAANTTGCNPQPPLQSVPISVAGDVVVDQNTNTVYVDGDPNDLKVIAAASCNANDTTCANTASVPLGADNGGGPIAIDSATGTLYVGGAADIAVVDTRHCNAQDMSGCATQTPATVPVAPVANALAIARDTLYDAEVPLHDQTAPSVVDVIDTRHCRAGDTSGCARQPAGQVNVGVFPADTAVDLAHHTLYVPINAFADLPGRLAMIDIMHCDGDDTSGCAQTVATTPLPRGPGSATLDAATGTLYVGAFNDASVSLIGTENCNALDHAACQQVPRAATVGSGPTGPGLDPAHRTLYVPNLFDGTVSLVETGR